jgi:hypothetical protein
MFNLTGKIVDEVVDDIRPSLNAPANRKGWNGATKSSLSELKKILRKKRYTSFVLREAVKIFIDGVYVDRTSVYQPFG